MTQTFLGRHSSQYVEVEGAPPLGQGAYGSVHRAHYTDNLNVTEEVAVKVVNGAIG